MSPLSPAQTNFQAALKNLKFRAIGPAPGAADLAVVESDPRVYYIGAAGTANVKNGGAAERFFSKHGVLSVLRFPPRARTGDVVGDF